MAANFTININAPELFGGEDSEGGIVGSVEFLMGNDDQVCPPRIAALLGGLVPGFRGSFTAFFDGLLAVNNPYPKPWKFRVRRWSDGWDGEPWYPEKAMIALGDAGDGPLAIKAMNAAHIVYEAATNRDWGRGLDASMLNLDSFAASADTLYDEAFGLAMKWGRRDKLSAFVQSVVNHVGGSLYIDRGTGLLNFDLIRGDYDPTTVPTFDYSNGLLSVEWDDTSAQGETQISEVIVKYFDPRAQETLSVRAQNLALRQAAGVSNTVTQDYPGLPTAELGLLVANRDLKAYAMGLKRLKVTLDRRAYTIAPGKVFAIRAPDRGIERIILRAGKVRLGNLTDGKITVEAVQDVFGLPATAFVPQETGWVPPNTEAVEAPVRRMMEMTYRGLFQRLSAAELTSVDPYSGSILAMAGRPTATSVGFLVASRTDGEPFSGRATGSFSPVATLAAAMDADDTALSFDALLDMDFVEIGESCMIENEIMRVDAIDLTTGVLTVARGCEDTLPVPHPEDAYMWFPDGTAAADGREYAFGEIVEIKLLTKTSSETLSVEAAPSNGIEIVRRWFRPLPPGALKINGTAFAAVASVPAATDVVLTWAARNRVTQQDQLVDQTAAAIAAETGTTYTVRVYDGVTLKRTAAGITTSTWTYDAAMFAADGSPAAVTVELESVRDSLESFQRYRFTINRP